MKKLLKGILAIGVVLIVLVVLGVGVLVLVVNPNDYKSEMEKLFLEKTGLSLQLPGKITWSFWPSLGVKTSELRVLSYEKQPSPETSENNRLIFKGVDIGVNPWAFLRGHFSSDVSIKAESFSYNNLSIHQIHLQIKHFQLEAPFDFQFEGILQQGFARPITFNIQAEGFLKIKDSPGSEDLFKLNPLQAQFNQSRVEGSMEVQNFDQPIVTGELTSPRFDVSDWINLKGARLTLENILIATHFSLEGTQSAQVPSTLNGEAKIRVEHSTLKGVDIGKVLAKARQTLSGILNAGSSSNSLSLVTNLPALLNLSTPGKEKDVTSGGVTYLGAFSSDAVITRGVIQNNQITLIGDHFEVKGKGQVDLNQQKLDYRFNLNGADDKTPDRYTLPFVIQGKLSDPEMGIDYSALMGQLHEIIQSQMKNVLVQTLSGGAVGAVQEIHGLVGNLLSQ